MYSILLTATYLLVLSTHVAAGEYLVCKSMSETFNNDQQQSNCSSTSTSRQGPPGKQGPPGVKGDRGPRGIVGGLGLSRLEAMEQKLQAMEDSQVLKSSCYEIKRAVPESRTGIHYIRDANGIEYPVFCDMMTAGGGWTLVASVHENNLGESGRCTAGDRWSSEQGNTAEHPNGDGNWENRNLFGHVKAAASDDYKNAAYFELQASDVMVLHVPNDTPLGRFIEDATFQYHTTSGALSTYGGNLHELFKRYPLRVNVYNGYVDNGPSFAVEFDKGSAPQLLQQLEANAQGESEAGYIQFRTINHERAALAFCPGVRIRPNKANAEQLCVGGTSWQGHASYCGDFSAFDWPHSPGWASNDQRKNSVFMIFYR